MTMMNRNRGKQVIRRVPVQKGNKLNRRFSKISNCSEIPNGSDKNRYLPDLRIKLIIKNQVNQLIL